MGRRRRGLSDPNTMKPMPSFVDALASMLLVLVFIITLLSIFSGKVLEDLEGREKARQAQSKLDDDFAAMLSAQGVRIEREGRELRILLPEEILFASGEAEIRPAGEKVLDRLGPHLQTMTYGQIFVEGHTDDQAISGELQVRYPTNWELSSARATHVVRRFVANNGILPTRLTAQGLADTRPRAGNDTPDGRAQNRRIEIRLTP